MTEHLRYRGDVRDFNPDHLIGPDFGGRRLTIASVDYDKATDMSTATLRGVLPDRFRELVTPIVKQQRQRAILKAMFIG